MVLKPTSNQLVELTTPGHPSGVQVSQFKSNSTPRINKKKPQRTEANFQSIPQSRMWLKPNTLFERLDQCFAYLGFFQPSSYRSTTLHMNSHVADTSNPHQEQQKNHQEYPWSSCILSVGFLIRYLLVCLIQLPQPGQPSGLAQEYRQPPVLLSQRHTGPSVCRPEGHVAMTGCIRQKIRSAGQYLPWRTT
jgi:hypothetical protein